MAYAAIFIVSRPEAPIPSGAIQIMVGPGKGDDDWVVVDPYPVIRRFIASADPADLLDQTVLRRLYQQALEHCELKGVRVLQLMIKRVMEGKILALRPARPKDMGIVKLIAHVIANKTGCGVLPL